MTLAYRTAGPADAPALAAMGRLCFTETFGAHFPPDDMALHLEAMFGTGALFAEYRDPALKIRMAEEAGAIAAHLKLTPMTSERTSRRRWRSSSSMCWRPGRARASLLC